MKCLIFEVTSEDVGRLGITRRDVGKWAVLVSGCVHFRKNHEECLKLRACVEGV
jgi:hypothetical protein